MYRVDNKEDGIAYFNSGAKRGKCICWKGDDIIIADSLEELIQFYMGVVDAPLPDTNEKKET